MTPAAELRPALRFGGRVFRTILARPSENGSGVQIFEHFAHQKCTKKHDQTHDYRRYHDETLPFLWSEKLCAATQRGKKMLKLQPFARVFSGGTVVA